MISRLRLRWILLLGVYLRVVWLLLNCLLLHRLLSGSRFTIDCLSVLIVNTGWRVGVLIGGGEGRGCLGVGVLRGQRELRGLLR